MSSIARRSVSAVRNGHYTAFSSYGTPRQPKMYVKAPGRYGRPIAALSASVERRASLREKIQQFEQSIEQRRDETRRLAEEIAEGQSQLALPLQERSAEIVRRQINDNWVGSVESRDMLLYGRQSLLGSASPSSDFGQIWQDCRDGKDLELHNSKPGMLESLEHRIRQQNERVRRWKDFQKRFDQKSVYTNSGIQSPSTRPALIFSEHQSIRVDRSAPETEGTASRPIGAKYAETISCLKTGLDGVRSRKQQSLSQELQESRYSGSRDLSPHNGHLPLERALFSPVKGYIGREHVDKEDATLVEANRTSSPPVTGFTGSTLRDEAATSPWQPSPLQTPLQCIHKNQRTQAKGKQKADKDRRLREIEYQSFPSFPRFSSLSKLTVLPFFVPHSSLITV
ncbi:hypothetical protein M8818_003184 [Zalaria obscura]|uniref:Uncharacterized protein n=1 Tax=Zalaria obscura TaxID=2024903 RepID=A0ACC3SG87_9PEZI